MASENTDLWPYNPDASRPSTKINWFAADLDTMRSAEARVIRAVNKIDLNTLKTDQRLAHYWEALPDDAKDAALSVIEGRAVKTKGRTRANNPKDAIKGEIERVLSEAESEGDYSAQLKAAELLAKLDALLNEKKQMDPVININVNTGVPRG